MKIVFPVLTSLLLIFVTSAQAQDTTSRKQPALQNAAPKTPHVNQSPDSNPVINKIAVSDPGMPPEKPASTGKKRGAGKPEEKKKKSNAGVTPK